MEATAIVSSIAAVFAAVTAFLFSANGSPLWIGFAGGALMASGLGWALWRRVRSYLCVLRYRRRIRGHKYMNSVMLLGAVSRALPQLTLDDVYVDVALRNDETESGGQKVYGSPTRPGERATLDDFLNRGDGLQFAVYGMPGSGKSTLLRSTAMRMSHTIRPGAPIPILIVLSHHTAQIVENPAIDLAEVAASARWLDRDGVPVHEIRRWLAKGRCVIMLDGLDEVPEQHRAAVMLWAEQQHGGYEQCNLVVTSRELGFESARFDAADLVLEVCPLTRDQIDLFIENCYRAFRMSGDVDGTAAAAEESVLLAGLRADPALYDLASTPLLLQLMVYVHRYSDDGLPASRGELYERMIQMLLHERRSRLKLSVPANRLELGPKQRIVQRLALEQMIWQQVQFDPLPQIAILVEAFEIGVSAQGMLRDLRENGLLSRLDSDTYVFAHLSFQEYLAAKELHERGLIKLLTDSIRERWWRNTALFWASAYDPNPLIEACIGAGTAETWSLAIELQREAELGGREVDPKLTARVDAFLAEDHLVGSSEHEVVCAELIARNCREVTYIDGVEICTRPVDGALYRLFAKEKLANGLWPAAHRFGPRGEVMGLWPSEVAQFQTWLKRFDHRGFSYHLPARNTFPIERAAWTHTDARLEPVYPNHVRGSGFKVSEQQLADRIRADWRFMLSRFDLTGYEGEARLAAQQIRRACATLAPLAESYKARLRTALPRNADTVAARTLATHRAWADSFATTVEELTWFAESDSINLLAVMRLVTSLRIPAGPGPSEAPSIPAAAIKEQLELLQVGVRTAVQVSFRLHRDCFRPDQGAPTFLKAAGALLLSCRLPAEGTPSAYKPPKRLTEALRADTPVFPQGLPSLLEEVKDNILRSKPNRLRPRKVLVGMLDEMRAPMQDLIDRRTELDLDLLAALRIGLYSVAIWMEIAGPDPLWSCVNGLAAIEARHRGEIDIDEVILLERRDQS
jgi:hypothetical protein